MTSVASTDTTTTATTTTSAATSTISSDFNMFLKLLTTQMQNQDPLKPMDSTEYTQQLAQYSQVEQTVKQTGVLNSILDRLGTQDMTQASALIGRSATFDSAVSGLSSDTPAQWRLDLPAGTAAASITIKDASGKTVVSRDIDASTTNLGWDGKLADGTTAPAGQYTLSVKATDASGSALTAGIASVGTVSEVGSTGGAVTLSVNGVDMPLSTVKRLTAAS